MTQTRDRRIHLGREMHQNFAGVVRYGAFKGMRIGEFSSWTPSDMCPRLLGTYEIEVIDAVVRLLTPGKTFVNIGAANGYYAIGLLLAGMCRTSITFDLNPDGQRSIAKSAAINGVGDRVMVLGRADQSLPNLVQEAGANLGECVLLVDIEGAEHSTLTSQTLSMLARTPSIIELHGGMVENGEVLQAQLIARLQDVFDVAFVRTGTRSFDRFPELAALSDDDRWLMASDERPYLMEWAVCSPRSNEEIR